MDRDDVPPGGVSGRFRIDASGIRDSARNTLLLRETYRFDDGHVDPLEWTITTGSGDQYHGSEPRLVGEARGERSGPWFRWRYTRRVPSKDGSETKLTFDDCFWMLDSTLVLARASVTTLGFEVAVITVVYQKR